MGSFIKRTVNADPVYRLIAGKPIKPMDQIARDFDGLGVLGINPDFKKEPVNTSAINYGSGLAAPSVATPPPQGSMAPQPISAVQKLQDRYQNLMALKAYRSGR